MNFASQCGLCALLVLSLGLLAAGAQVSPDMTGETKLSVVREAPNECQPRSVSYQDDQNLTREEKIAKMDAALSKSLNRYDDCQTKNSASAASSSGGVGGGASVAASGMRGTEPAKQVAPAPALSTGAGVESGGGAPEKQGQVASTLPAARNGKVSEDIPPADNDSVLEAQIRTAAENEPDPDLRKKLWNEYRRYKGLPPVN